MTDAKPGLALNDKDFRRILQIAAKEAGLAIPPEKKSLVQSRVARRMRHLGLTDSRDYLLALDHDQAETQQLVSALTTNVSHFFRERHHFDTLRDMFLSSTVPSKLRFWSAGCSNGQEPYSLAIEILKSVPDAARRDILILASDIDHGVIDKATTGVYSQSEIENVPPPERDRFLTRTVDGHFRVKDEVRGLVRFRKLNLNGPAWPMQGPFDAILCRNVVIYFSDETQEALWPRFHALLRPGGLLMLGHSERIQSLAVSGFTTAGVTTYRKL